MAGVTLVSPVTSVTPPVFEDSSTACQCTGASGCTMHAGVTGHVFVSVSRQM